MLKHELILIVCDYKIFNWRLTRHVVVVIVM